jgi:hypothetical protein
MANAVYDKARQAYLAGDLDWDANDIKVVLVTSGYTFSQSHQYLSSIDDGYRVATSGNLANRSVADGVADADDVVFSSVSGSQIAAIVIYQDSGNEATSRLIAFIDDATGLPCTPNGSDITLVWPSDATKIFKL